MGRAPPALSRRQFHQRPVGPGLLTLRAVAALGSCKPVRLASVSRCGGHFSVAAGSHPIALRRATLAAADLAVRATGAAVVPQVYFPRRVPLLSGWAAAGTGSEHRICLLRGRRRLV